MIICPNCSSTNFSETKSECNSCKWRPLERNGVLDYLSDYDRASNQSQEYSKNYDDLAKTNLKESNIDRTFLHNQSKNLIKYIGAVKDKVVCEIGVGQGFLCKEFISSNAKSIVAVDIAISYLTQFTKSKKIKPYLANAESLPFSNEFDLIVSTDCMEHVINVGSYLYCANRALKDGGLLAIRVPYREGLLEYSPYRKYPHKYGHLRSFNKDILKIYMEQAGFDIKSFHLDGYSLGSPHVWLYNKTWKKNLYHKLINFIQGRLNHPADVTLINPFFAKLIMRPAEVVVVAKKIKNIKTL
jgi:SAM-dependent methyltransferase